MAKVTTMQMKTIKTWTQEEIKEDGSYWPLKKENGISTLHNFIKNLNIRGCDCF